MTRSLRGIGVSPAWPARRRSSCGGTSPRCPTRGEAGARRARGAPAARAVDYVVSHLHELGQRVLQRAGPEESRIFDAQILMAQDEEFLGSVETLIRKNT